MEISPWIFWGCRLVHFFSAAIFWFSPEKCRNLHSEWWFLHFFFGWTNSLLSFFSCDFSVFTRSMNFSIFLVGKFSVLLCSTVNFPVSPEEVKKPAFWIDLNFLLFKLHFLVAPNWNGTKISFLGFLCFLVGGSFIFWLWIVHVFQENRTVSILKRGLAFSFHFQHFSAEKCTNPQSFFCRLLFAKKNWNKEAPCNTEKPPLRMETYPVLFWFVSLKFLRILLLHLESLMLIKKWNHNHSEQINIHSEWRHNFTKRMHQPACKMEKYRFWMGKSPCMFSFKFDQKEWNTTCSEPTTFIQHEDFSDSFSST